MDSVAVDRLASIKIDLAPIDAKLVHTAGPTHCVKSRIITIMAKSATSVYNVA